MIRQEIWRVGKYIVGITGASGPTYAKRVIERLIQKGHRVCARTTQARKLVMEFELSQQIGQDTPSGGVEQYLQEIFGLKELIRYYGVYATGAPIVSGSSGMDAMIVVPCSMGTLSAIRHGSSYDLLERAADVCLRERCPLVIVPREAPYNQIHLENTTKLSGCGAVIISASPGFYSRPKAIEEMVDLFVTRILDQMGTHESSEGR